MGDNPSWPSPSQRSGMRRADLTGAQRLVTAEAAEQTSQIGSM
jgi:hypothetical protein